MEKEAYFYVAFALFAVLLAVIVSATPSWQTGFPGKIFNLTEDVVFRYNFSQNVSNPLNEGLLFEIVNVSVAPDLGFGNSPSNYPWISINSVTGNLTFNSTNDTQTGYFTVTVRVENASNGAGPADLFYFNVSAVNDPPQFQGLANQSFNMSTLFSYVFNITDEENNTPYKLNITFTNCSLAQWSTRGTDCTLFSNYTLSYIQSGTVGEVNITFNSSTRNDVGSYIIRFNATDSGNTWQPHNNSFSQDVNFTVLVVNSAPYFRYACDNERNATENSQATCYINVSDIDELRNITFSSNTSWFTFNNSATVITVPTNITYNYTASALVKFTPTDIMVGHWLINITVNDTGSPTGFNSTVFQFNVSNVPDFPVLQNLSPINIYTSNNYTVYINASDDDLLIPDKSVFYEFLNFTSNDSHVSIERFQYFTDTNITMAKMTFNGSSFSPGSAYLINITVTDNSSRMNSTLVVLNVSTNHAPVWINNTSDFTFNESSNFFLNLSTMANDSDGNPLNFIFTNLSYFPNFNLVQATGIINFTPNDADVGYQVVIIGANDSIAITNQMFTFTIYNMNETPVIKPLSVENASINSTTLNITAQEDNVTFINLTVFDADFNITQKSYYNETLSVSLNISGPDPLLFSFPLFSLPDAPGNGLAVFRAVFTPNKSDVGSYQINVTVTDNSSRMVSLRFNMTVQSINHAPNLPFIDDMRIKVNQTLSFDLNGSDVEDGGEGTGNLTYNYSFLNDGNADFINHNQTIFNITFGTFNMTFNDSMAGAYHVNITLKDSTNLTSSRLFWIYVYDTPVIDNTPPFGSLLSAKEGNQTQLEFFKAHHSAKDNLTYDFYLRSVLRYEVNLTSDGMHQVSWDFTPAFTDESYDNDYPNITLFVYNKYFPELNASANWSINISHANAPVVFNGTIGDQGNSYDQQIIIPLGKYFYDADAFDEHYNQTLNFTVYSNMSSNSTITVTITNGSFSGNVTAALAFSASSVTAEEFNITATDGQYFNSSGQFTLTFTQPSTVVQPVSVPSGGGGGSTKPIALKIIVPGPVSSKKNDKLIVPITVENTGQITLSGIVLRNAIAKNGLLRSDLLASFDKSFIDILSPGQHENLTLIVDVNTDEPGLYEITLNGTSTVPSYSDTAKLYVNVEQGATVNDRLIFTEELIAQNPECKEIQERVDKAKSLLEAGNSGEASVIIEEAVQACQKAISQSSILKQRVQLYDQLLNTTTIALLSAFVLGFVYYWYRRIMFERELRREQADTNPTVSGGPPQVTH